MPPRTRTSPMGEHEGVLREEEPVAP
jgi:hypothetical protein